MVNKRITPRCPRCDKRVGGWLEGNGGYTCRSCRTEFEIVDGRVLVVKSRSLFPSHSSIEKVST